MDKKDLINRYSRDDEQKILLGHIYDLMLRCENRNALAVSDFISESDCASVESFLNGLACKNYILFGGYDGAERKCAVFLPDYLTSEDICDEPSLADICYVKARVGKFNESSCELSHRDVLGSLMGLGIERGTVGDIVVNGPEAVFVCKSKISEYLRNNLDKISRYPVDVEVKDKYSIDPHSNIIECSDTVASLRLDAVVAAAFNLSRSASSDAIGRGVVFVNGVSADRCDHLLKQGDKISLRGRGKIVISTLGGTTKKGRIRIVFQRYT